MILKYVQPFDQQNMVHTEKSRIVTTVYTKPCAGNSLLRADSCHPRHFNKGIPRGQFLRLRRNPANYVTNFYVKGMI